ncbi:MAG: GTPase domain-containing protein [Methylibium sp.]|uniref:GTPase domain-containing protein n=1 Tax=Methylibium sp. TaxID=2067992 RepID=UPI00181EAAF3|nr:GTPase domain-containing protein [Methylibium sp.]MBA3598553.1 GTPase domain-containing protein [Methylibium sp.]
MNAHTVALSLVSHTNVGKTTLARTLLQHDIGEVRDEAHVTLEAERHTLIEAPGGERLELWDTPGFGDSVRLAKRLAQSGNPIGWFLGEVWDRFRDRAFWSAQRAVRNVLEEADVVLYLVNASEAPEDAGYLDAELQVLDLIGKPVVVLLNQLGPPQRPGEEALEVRRWRERAGGAACVREVLALDAFARCWVQEGRLLDAVAAALPLERQARFAPLREAWRGRGQATWQAAMDVLAERLARAALDREPVRESGWSGKLKEAGAALGLRREGAATPRELAMRSLAERLDADIRRSTDQLIRLHGLDGHATDVVLTRLAEHYAVHQPLSEGKAAVWGGVLTGALAGLKADIASAGMTLGGGLLAGGVLGALGAAGLARGVNLLRGDTPSLAWSDTVLDELARSALLGYLAVAHYGRGRGEWAAAEHPDFWSDSVNAVLETHTEALHALWAERSSAGSAATASAPLRKALRTLLAEASAELLARLYLQAPTLDVEDPGLDSDPDVHRLYIPEPDRSPRSTTP